MNDERVFYHGNDKTVQYDIATPMGSGEYAPATGLVGLTITIAGEPNAPALDPALEDISMTERPQMNGRYYANVDGQLITDHMPPDLPVYVGIKLPGDLLVWEEYMVRELRT